MTEFHDADRDTSSPTHRHERRPGHSCLPDGTSSRNTSRTVNSATLAGRRADGFYRDSAGVHVLTRHLTYFAFFVDRQPPSAPRDLAGVVAEDGLTLRWLPGTDASGQLGKIVLFVNGEPYRNVQSDPVRSQAGRVRRGRHAHASHLLQLDAAGNVSHPYRTRSAWCRQLTGKSPRRGDRRPRGCGLRARPGHSRSRTRPPCPARSSGPPKSEAGAGVERDRPRGRTRGRVPRDEACLLRRRLEGG